MKRSHLFSALSIISIILIVIINKFMWFGKIINSFFPCEQNPVNSFPCFGIYDIYAIIFLGIVLLVSIILLMIALFQKTK